MSRPSYAAICRRQAASAPPASRPETLPGSSPDSPLSLAAAFQAALKAPASTAAQQLVIQAQARVAEAQAQLRFGFSFSSSAAVSNGAVLQPPPSRETFGSLNNTIAVSIPIGHRLHVGVDQAEALLVAAQAQLDTARLALALQISEAYFELPRKQAALINAREMLATAERQLSDAQKRYQAGDVPEIDVLRAQGPVSAAQAEVDNEETTVVIARESLNSLIDRPLDSPLSVAEIAYAHLPVEMPMTRDEARRMARENSPDARAAEAQARASRLARKSAGLYREPSLSVQASDSRSGDQTGFSRLDSLQAIVTFPLSDGGLSQAQARESDAALTAALAQIEAARRGAEAAASAAYRKAESSRHQVIAAQATKVIAQTSYERIARGYRAGLFPLTDVLSAQSALAQARVAETQAVYDAAVAFATLYNCIGKLP